MTLHLLPMPYTLAHKILTWCWEHNIDSEKCYKLVDAMATHGKYQLNGEDWTIDIPDKYVSWFVLKWGCEVTEGANEL